jgi:hypothetical protein
MFRKSSFVVRGDLYELLQEEIEELSKRILVQVDLLGLKVDLRIQKKTGLHDSK